LVAEKANFVWDPGIFKILGVKFSTDLHNISNINYEDKMLEIQRAIKMWNRRKITPFGKITVIKSMLISKLTHLLISLPDPSEQFINRLEKEFFKFLWDGKNKIKKSVVCKPYFEGGLRMLDIKSFIASLKMSWLKKLRADSDWRTITINMYPELANLHKYGMEYANVLMRQYSNLFWKDVFRHYKKLYTKSVASSLDEFLAECIHYNINILRDRRIVFVKEWMDAGIIYIIHLINDNGTLMSFQDFQARYPNIMRTNFLMYEGIITAIRAYQHKLLIDFSRIYKNMDPKVWTIIMKGNKQIQSQLLKSDSVPTAIGKWNGKYDYNFFWDKIFKLPFNTTIDVQLRWFQLRVLNRILPTEKYLHTCKIVDSPLCKFCLREDQTIEHLFWKCPVVKTFWDSLLVVLKDKCVHADNLRLNEILIIFGMCNQTVTDRGLDNIILWAKFYLYKSKMQRVIPNIQGFLPILKSKINIEKYISRVNGTEKKYEHNWRPYLSLLNV
jgi:hypothetical protein